MLEVSPPIKASAAVFRRPLENFERMRLVSGVVDACRSRASFASAMAGARAKANVLP